MTIPQLFRWFCKEQKINHHMQKMYNVIHPHQVKYLGPNSFDMDYLTFDKYIKTKVNDFGFTYLLDRILLEYSSKIRFNGSLIGNAYLDWYRNLMEDFNPFIKKWYYFVKHNIVLDGESIKVGNVLRYKHWGRIDEIKIKSFDIGEGRIYGDAKIDGRYSPTIIRLNDLIDDNDKAVEVNFAVKRNGKMYYGKNKQ